MPADITQPRTATPSHTPSLSSDTSSAHHLLHSRPAGPRSNPRASSPTPPYPSLSAPTPPLQIRKVSRDPPPHSPPSSRALSINLNPPSAHLSPTVIPRSNGLAEKPKLHLSLLNSAFTDGSAFGGDYYQGPANLPLESENTGGVTVRPPDPNLRTPRPEEPDNAIADIIKRIGSASLSDSYRSNEDPSSDTQTEWSDSVLEELDRLGEGQGGVVYKVRDKRTGQIYARKTITTREAPLKQLERELAISSTTRHHNIIRFYGAYMSSSSSEVKVVMEFGAGGSLEAVGKRIKERQGRISESVAGRLAEGILQGLAYLHSLKTIHRDIKPSNVLLTREGIVRLCDFGVSGELVRSEAGTFTGTSLYMAPERISGQTYTIRSDVWSTGITLLELVQNRYPFPAELTSIELLVCITKGDPPQLTDEPGITWSDEMKDFIRQTLIVDADKRPAPKDMLSHIWVVNAMKQEVQMARFISQVWGWSKSQVRSHDSHSRPSSSKGLAPRTNSTPPEK